MSGKKTQHTISDFSVCVILYHPTQETFENISKLLQLDNIYISDNTEGPINKWAEKIMNLPGVYFFHDGVNWGIGARLNEMCKQAIKRGAHFLLTLDQDSYFDDEMLFQYLECFKNFQEKSRVGMFGVNHKKKTSMTSECVFGERDFLITSGSIVNLEIFKAIEGFNEFYFIDYVDTEYCLRLKQFGFRCVVFDNIILHHNLGIQVKGVSFKNLQTDLRSIHSPSRLFFMVRNFFFLKKTYGKKFPAIIKKIRKDLLVRLKNNILFNPARFSVIKNIFKGYLSSIKKGSLFL